VALLSAPSGSGPWPAAVSGASAFVSLASLVATGALGALAWLGLIAGAIALLYRRWFCRWACPTGLCADGAAKLGLRARRRCPRLPPLGQWIAVGTLAGAVVGYPLLLWLDHLALLSGAFGLQQVGGIPSAAWGAVGFGLVLIVSFVFPGAWCTRVCPLGALQDMLARLSEEARRRARRPRADEARFTGVCMRCGSCARACPTEIIRPDLGRHGVAGLLTPTLDFEADYCREDCVRCTEVCPSGALRPVSVEDKIHGRIGVPRVDMDLCLLGDDRECSVCRNRCPYEAIRLVFSEEEYTLTPVVDLDRCPGCGACEAACPTRPTKAIVVESRLALESWRDRLRVSPLGCFYSGPKPW
jgi:ferredoxin-type protein NapF